MRIELTLNGAPRIVEAEPMARLLDVLRRDLGLTGSKEGCGEGECGACTVLLDGAPVCSCLVPMAQLAGRNVTTVEGIAEGPRREQIERFQRVFVGEGAAQCGACTPGMIVTLAALLEKNPRPTRADIRDFASGTLCRCTGYERIFRAVEVMTGQRPPEGTGE